MSDFCDNYWVYLNAPTVDYDLPPNHVPHLELRKLN